MLPDFSGRCRFRRTSTWRIRHQYHGNDLQCKCNKCNLSMDCRRQELDITLYLPITMKLIDGALSWTVWKQIVDTDDCSLHNVTILSEKSVFLLFPIPHAIQFGLLNAIGNDTWTTLLIGASVVPHCLTFADCNPSIGYTRCTCIVNCCRGIGARCAKWMCAGPDVAR